MGAQTGGNVYSEKGNIHALGSEGREKYVRELWVTSVGYFTGAIGNRSRGVPHGDYFAWQK
jgi:hypothetical protein